MHISDGVLSTPVTVAGWGGAVCCLAGSMWGVREERIPQAAVLTACFFVGSTIHVPLGGTSVHLVLNGLCGVVLGPVAFLAVFLGLLLQFLLFSHGGLTSLGFNACSMGIPALCAWALFRAGIRLGAARRQATVRLLAFCVGAGAVLLSAAFVALGLAASGKTFQEATPVWLSKTFQTVAPVWFVLHVPLAVIEGVVTAATVAFLMRVEERLLGIARTAGGGSRS